MYIVQWYAKFENFSHKVIKNVCWEEVGIANLLRSA
jgi:hypothetical protein